MALLDPRLLEIEILSEAERKTFAGGTAYEHRRDGSVDREREEALMELMAARAIVYAKSYRTENMGHPEYALNEAASTAVAHLLTSATIIPLKITQAGRLREPLGRESTGWRCTRPALPRALTPSGP